MPPPDSGAANLHQESPSGIHIGHTPAPGRPARHAHEAEGTGMTDATVDKVRRYVLDGNDDDLRRLLSLSESFAEHARRAGTGRRTARDRGAPAAIGARGGPGDRRGGRFL